MVKMVDRNFQEEQEKIARKNLMNLVNSMISKNEIVGIMSRTGDIGLYNTNFRGFFGRKLAPYLGVNVITIEREAGLFFIDVKDKKYLSLARALGEEIERKYVEKVEIAECSLAKC